MSGMQEAVRPADAGLGVAVATGLLVTTFAAPGPPPVVAATVVLAVVVAAAIGLRRRHPVATLAVLDAVTLVWFLAAGTGQLVVLAPLVGCYTVAAHRGWRWGLAGAVPTALVQIVAIRVVLGDDQTVGVVPIMVLLAATASSAGAAVGYYRAALAATRAQLAREASTREERDRRLVVEERLRIARELHDVVGHTLAAVSVQAGVGLHVAGRRPEQARAALAAIKKVCDESLVDVRAILDALRDGTATEGRGLDRLTDLLDTVETAGLRVEVAVDGEPRPLPVPVDLAAYRIVQEALTNVLRHAGARTVQISLTHEPTRLLLRVRDDGTGTATGSGHGIDGMRERARALSGRLTAGPRPGGGFDVHAELPLPPAP